MTKTKPILLRFSHIVREELGKFAADKRRIVNMVLASYRGEDGHEYRKSFSTYDVMPSVPESGTHKELNALMEQW